MFVFLKQHNIILLCFLLIVSLSSLSVRNYFSQRDIILKQLNADTDGIVNAISSSITKFSAIKNRVSIQDLIRNVSLHLDIFEFRYMDKDGVILNSMFPNEIGSTFKFLEIAGESKKHLGRYYEDNRDMTSVLAIAYPVKKEGKLIGIIDLAIDISEFEYIKASEKPRALQRIKLHVSNLLAAISGSVVTSLEIMETIDFFDFLNNLLVSTGSILEVAIIDQTGKVVVSSHKDYMGLDLGQTVAVEQRKFVELDGEDTYLIVTNLSSSDKGSTFLMLSLDARTYWANLNQLLIVAIVTTILTILFSLTIAYSIYRINLERTTREKEQLEIRVKERTMELAKANEKLEKLSITDGLTGLANRRRFDVFLGNEMGRAVRDKTNLSLILLDIDYFKKYNDGYGHAEGDKCLKIVANVFAATVKRTGDLLARYGGEEFAVVLTNTDKTGAEILAEELRIAVESKQIQHEFSEICDYVTITLGVTFGIPNYKTRADTIIKKADEALYRGKKGGRNQVATEALTED